MSYQAGGASSPHDLLQQWATFLVAAGWTLDYDNGATPRIKSLSKGNKHFTFRSFIAEAGTQLGSSGTTLGSGIAMVGHTTPYVDGGVNFWQFQTGAPVLYGQTVPMSAIMFTPSGLISNYWMFADAAGDNIALVAFKSSGVYTYLYGGDLVKVQAWTGTGVYYGGSSPMPSGILEPVGTTTMPPPPGAINSNKAVGFLKADVDSFVNKWTSLTHNGGPSTITATGKAMQASAHMVGSSDEVGDNIGYYGLRTSAASARTGALIMLPIIWLVERDFGGALTGGGWSIAGTVPYIFQTKSDGFVPGATFNISTDTYVVFPGFAIRKFP